MADAGRMAPTGNRGGSLKESLFCVLFLSILLLNLRFCSAAPKQDVILQKTKSGGSEYGYSAGKVDDAQSSTNLFKDIISFFSNANEWIWPQDYREGIPPHLHSILVSWCGDTYEDVMVDAQRKSEQFEQLKSERDSLRLDVINRRNEFNAKEQELKSECEKSTGMLRNSYELSISKIKSDHVTEKSQLKVDLEACELKVRRQEETACEKWKLVDEASWTKKLKDCEAELNSCVEKSKIFNSTHVSQLESTLLTLHEEKKSLEFRNKRLSSEVSECRPSKAAFEARLKEVLADGTIASLEKAIFRLQNLVLFLFSVLVVLSVLLFYIFQVSGDTIALPSYISFLQASPAVSVSVLKSEDARGELQTMYQFRGGRKAKPLLISSSENNNLYFLLIPINLTDSRCFLLFGSSGDYFTYFEKAQEFVGRESGGKQIVVVLYEASGCFFSQDTLQRLNLTAENIAHRTLPEDSDSPSKDHLVVGWFDKEGLNISNSEGISPYFSSIKTEVWANYLLERSGRYGEGYSNQIKDE